MIRTIAAALLAGCFGGMVDSVHEDTALGYLQSINPLAFVAWDRR